VWIHHAIQILSGDTRRDAKSKCWYTTWHKMKVLTHHADPQSKCWYTIGSKIKVLIRHKEQHQIVGAPQHAKPKCWCTTKSKNIVLAHHEINNHALMHHIIKMQVLIHHKMVIPLGAPPTQWKNEASDLRWLVITEKWNAQTYCDLFFV
jgi:hypothetical protein